MFENGEKKHSCSFRVGMNRVARKVITCPQMRTTRFRSSYENAPKQIRFKRDFGRSAGNREERTKEALYLDVDCRKFEADLFTSQSFGRDRFVFMSVLSHLFRTLADMKSVWFPFSKRTDVSFMIGTSRLLSSSVWQTFVYRNFRGMPPTHR